MDDTKSRAMAATIRRCLRSKHCRPSDVTRADEQMAVDAGYLEFVEWPSGHYVITSAGQEFMAERAAA